MKIAFSQDAGATFSQPIQVDDGKNVGRVDTLLLPDGSALVVWLGGDVAGGEIKARRVRADGSIGPAAVIAKTDVSRSSGFPRMARGNEVHLRGRSSGLHRACARPLPRLGRRFCPLHHIFGLTCRFQRPPFDLVEKGN